MKASDSTKELAARAAEALRALLRQLSAIEVKEIKLAPAAGGREVEMLAHIGVLGHNHTLACRVTSNTDPRNVRRALRDLRNRTAHLTGDSTPVLIAPYLPPETRALCDESKAGFMDLEENARLFVGEVFIGKRSHRCRTVQPSFASSKRIEERSAAPAFPPVMVDSSFEAHTTPAFV